MNNQKTNENNILDIRYTHNVSEGNLLNGAKKLKDYNFVYYIGGVNEGSSEVSVNVSDSCIYYLLLEYISYEANLSFKINVNNIESIKIYYTDFFSQWSINTPLTFTIPLLLNSGDNIIKFYGNGNEKAPYLGGFSLALPPTTNDLSMGMFENNAYIDFNTGFVNAIGGPKDGSVIVTVHASIKGMHNLIFNYICGDVSRSLKIYINGIDSNYIYTVPSTGRWDKNSIQTFTVPVIFNTGNNTIKFHGDGINYGPNLGSILVKPINNASTSIFAISKVYKVSSGTLANGATIDKTTNIVTKIGGVDDGYAIVKVPVDILGDYLIKLNYTNGNKYLKIDINGIESSIIYNLSNKSGVFSTTLPLVVGINQLKFHGNGKDYVPDLNDFTIDLIKNTASTIFNGTASNKAIILSKGIVTGIGGVNDGQYSLKYKADNFGWYDLYLTLDTTKGTILALDVNFDLEDLIYTIPKSDDVIVYIIPLLLKKDINKITFHGDYKNTAPDILKIEIKSNTIIKDYNYEFINGFLEGGATINFYNKLVENIGGINNGSVTIDVNVPTEASYDLKILYIGESIAKTLKIDIINNQIVTKTASCKLPPLDSQNKTNFQSCKITLPLIKGDSKIKFYGNGINTVAKLKEVQILESSLKEELFSKTYELSKNNLYYGAKEAQLRGFVDIGGKNHGQVILNGIVPRATEYKMEIKYLTMLDNAKFGIIIFGTFHGDFISCPKTNSLIEKSIKTITVTMFLPENFTLHLVSPKDGNAPWLGSITITENKLSTPYKINSIDYYNGARLYNGQEFISLIGGPKNGRIELMIDVLDDGFYDLGFKYLCAFNVRTLNIDVNEKSYVKSYKLPLTENWDMINTQTFTVPLKFKKGSNVVTFKGNVNEFAPIIGKFNLVVNKTIIEINYKTSDGILKNGAKINSYGLVTNIGGPKKGEVSVKVNVKYDGKYVLSINYKPIYEASNLEIMINNSVYYMEKEKDTDEWSLIDMPTLKAIVYLFSGENIINFRGVNLGDGKINYAPFLENFTLIKYSIDYSIEKKLPKGSYDLTKGKLENGAIILDDFVTDLGDYNDGTVTIIVKVEEKNNYFMTINYIALETAYLMFNINGEENGNIYLFKSNSCFIDEEEFEIKLKKGDNIIKFYGVKNITAPRINIISIRSVYR